MKQYRKAHNKDVMIGSFDRSLINSKANTPVEYELNGIDGQMMKHQKSVEEQYDKLDTSIESKNKYSIIQTERMKKGGRFIKLYDPNTGAQVNSTD